MCTVLEIAEETVPKTKQLPSLTLFIMVNLLLITAAISLVVMGSKSCDIASAVKLTELSRKVFKCDFNRFRYIPTFGMTLCARFRTICLIVFPILTFLNLLVLLLNM
ncbi:hypothetical protein GCK32_011901 [Trichostrongylus colubriformis]|uniref:Uncharacterized protein n=1 Tax=Trichostrongylus colubriformis TaxID=6319 RepID=A0AAN8G4L4_TRICO